MVVTVLGSSGRTGRHVVRLLVRQGHQVRANGRRKEAVAGLGATPVLTEPRTENRGFDLHNGRVPVSAALAALDR